MKAATRLHSVLFGAATLLSLGFGAAQAFASPAETAARRVCGPLRCNGSCVAQGYEGGSCVSNGFGDTVCECY